MTKELAHPPVLERNDAYYKKLFLSSKKRREGFSGFQIFLISLIISISLIVTFSYVFLISSGGKIRFSPEEESLEVPEYLQAPLFLTRDRFSSFETEIFLSELSFFVDPFKYRE